MLGRRGRTGVTGGAACGAAAPPQRDMQGRHLAEVLPSSLPVPLPVPVPLPSTSGVGVLVGGLLKGTKEDDKR